MNRLLILPVITTITTGCASYQPDPYAKVGIGYKLDETEVRYDDGESINHPISARFEAGFRDGPITFGVSHHSQWFTGWPVDASMEYQKTEIFIDYEFDLSHL